MSVLGPQSDLQQVILALFLSLRGSGFALGIGELLAALRAADALPLYNSQSLDPGPELHAESDLKVTLRLLWCHALAEEPIFERAWSAVVASLPSSQEVTPLSTAPEVPRAEAIQSPEVAQPRSAVEPAPTSAQPSFVPLPVRAPALQGTLYDLAPLQSYWPISRRMMGYSWRFLRRPVTDGPADVLDVEATVEMSARRGFFLALSYRRRATNHVHLALLIDQNGSMMPFHRFSRDIVETVRDESDLREEQVEAFYFQNVVADACYRNPHLTEQVALAEVLDNWTQETSVLIVSDAGAARGYRDMKRVTATAQWLARLRRKTHLLAWLNPMPYERWTGSSAGIIANLCPMFQMDPDGFHSAIDVARGQPLRHSSP